MTWGAIFSTKIPHSRQIIQQNEKLILASRVLAWRKQSEKHTLRSNFFVWFLYDN